MNRQDYIARAETDLKNNSFTYEGVIGLVDNFSCYVVTDFYGGPDIVEVFNWCTDSFGEHKDRWLFIPEVIEKGKTYWFLESAKMQTLFKLRWKISNES